MAVDIVHLHPIAAGDESRGTPNLPQPSCKSLKARNEGKIHLLLKGGEQTLHVLPRPIEFSFEIDVKNLVQRLTLYALRKVGQLRMKPFPHFAPKHGIQGLSVKDHSIQIEKTSLKFHIFI